MRLSELTKEYIRVPVSLSDGAGPVDVTNFDVEFALAPFGDEPAVGDWTPGDWDAGEARYLFDGPTLGLKGTYSVWIRINGVNERPVRQAGSVTIY